MRRLLLLRHAKSDQNSGVTDDHERPLNARGRHAAQRMGAYMKSTGYAPKLILCSTSARTRETLELLIPHLRGDVDTHFERSLYLADWPNILDAVRDVPNDASPLMVIGHNPGMEQLAIALALAPATVAERARAEVLAQKFPTGALAVFDFNVRLWEKVRPGTGKLVDFARPKDLPKDKDAGDAE